MKTAIQQAAELYGSHGLNLSGDLEYYLKYGYVFVTPDRLLMAREITKEGVGETWTPHGEGDCWYVRLAIGKGCLKWFINQAPYFRPWIAWQREIGRAHV